MLVVLAGYTLRGATGFGAGVVVIPFLLLVLPLTLVIPLVTTLGIIASFGQTVREFRHVDWPCLGRLVLPTLAGVALGLWLFTELDSGVLLKAFGAFIIGYALWSYVPRLGALALPRRALPALAGITGGAVATVFGGMAGPFYVIYLGALGLDKTRFRASISLVLLALGIVRASGYAGLGFFDRRVLALLMVLVPVMALGMLAGDRWHRRLDEAVFRRIVAALLVASGVALLLK